MVVVDVIERRYVDKAGTNALLVRLFGAGNFMVEFLDDDHVKITSPRALTEAEKEAIPSANQ